MKEIKIKSKKYTAIIMVIIAIVIAFEFYQSSIAEPKILEENQVELVKCVDGDTAEFTEIGKTRFLFIDTPESTTKVEPYGKRAAAFTCDKLRNAKMITYEYDGPTKDRYKRTLAWIFVDGKLLQELIAQEGYVKKYYDYKAEYKYENRIRKSLNDKYNIFEGK